MGRSRRPSMRSSLATKLSLPSGRLRGMPMFLAAGEKDGFAQTTRQAAEFYSSHGARVELEIWPGLAHKMDTDSQRLRAWLWANGPLRHVQGDLARASQAERIGRLAVLYEQSAWAEQAGRVIEQLQGQPAREALDQARESAEAWAVQARSAELRRLGDVRAALAVCEDYLQAVPASQRRGELLRQVEGLRADQAAWKAVRDREAGLLCTLWLGLAGREIARGCPGLAEPYLQKVLTDYGQTEWAPAPRSLQAAAGR